MILANSSAPNKMNIYIVKKLDSKWGALTYIKKYADSKIRDGRFMKWKNTSINRDRFVF